jgi:hypothetical protein
LFHFDAKFKKKLNHDKQSVFKKLIVLIVIMTCELICLEQA